MKTKAGANSGSWHLPSASSIYWLLMRNSDPRNISVCPHSDDWGKEGWICVPADMIEGKGKFCGNIGEHIFSGWWQNRCVQCHTPPDNTISIHTVFYTQTTNSPASENTLIVCQRHSSNCMSSYINLRVQETSFTSKELCFSFLMFFFLFMIPSKTQDCDCRRQQLTVL